MLKRLLRKPYRAVVVAKNDGIIILAIRSLEKLYRKLNPSGPIVLHSAVKADDILKANWLEKDDKRFKPKGKKKKSYTINWVMSPPGQGSGGHQNIFRFIQYLEKAGHKNRVYLYSNLDPRQLEEILEVLKDPSYSKLKASIEWLSGEMKDADAIFATGWETAYPVFNSGITAKRLYFVQDFEPYFNPVGSEYVLAENSYRFGFHGVTAGGWLANKLHTEFGMQTDNYDFGADKKTYKFTNDKKRKEIFFYARPVTTRRGFELGLLTLAEFHKKHPDYTINLAGWDVSDYHIPFPHKNLTSMPISELSDVYNRCAAGLVISLTNMSLLPLELLACGTIPVVNDGPNNRMVSDNEYIAYTPNNPTAMAEKLSEIVTMKDLPKHAKKASESVAGADWDVAGKKFVEIVEGSIQNG